MVIFLPWIFHGHGGKKSQLFLGFMKNCEYFEAKIQFLIVSIVTM